MTHARTRTHRHMRYMLTWIPSYIHLKIMKSYTYISPLKTNIYIICKCTTHADESSKESSSAGPDVHCARDHGLVHVLSVHLHPARLLHSDQRQPKPGVNDMTLVWSFLKARLVPTDSKGICGVQ